jgi:hypothetical protein
MCGNDMDIDNNELRKRLGNEAFQLWTRMVDNRDWDDIQMISIKTSWYIAKELELHSGDGSDIKFVSALNILKEAKLISRSLHDSDSTWGFVRMVWGWKNEDGTYSVPQRTIDWFRKESKDA